MRYVSLVTGPPCAGKTTFVDQNRGPDDIVADLDEIAHRLGSAPMWAHTPETAAQANAEMDRIIDQAAHMEDGTAWIIRSAPKAEFRARLARLVGADRTIVLLPPANVLSERAQQRPSYPRTNNAIIDWRRQYSAWPGDELIQG